MVWSQFVAERRHLELSKGGDDVAFGCGVVDAAQRKARFDGVEDSTDVVTSKQKAAVTSRCAVIFLPCTTLFHYAGLAPVTIRRELSDESGE